MRVIIAAKSSSNRVPNKNWRPFSCGQSLVEIKIEQLLKCFDPNDIFLSCEDESKQWVAEKYQINFLLRDKSLCEDTTHWSDVVTGCISQIPCGDDEDIAWVLATCPLFDGFRCVIDTWETVKGNYDSLVTVKPFRHFLIDDKARPINFNFGRWHQWSQDLPKVYVMESPIHILPKKVALRCAYYIGTKPYLYEIDGRSIDIDEPWEFEIAQQAYASHCCREQPE